MSQQPPSEMYEPNDLGVTHTDADVDSDTRFGPRPVPKGHRRPSGPHESRSIPPHGDVSPDGTRIWPRPSRAAKWLVWGGTTIAAAALTAGALMAARHVSDILDTKAKPETPPRPQPRAAAAPQPERPMRSAPQPMRRRKQAPPRPRLMDEVSENTAHLTRNLDSVIQSVTAAFTGFRTVAGQASTLMREFQSAADLARGFMGGQAQNAPPASRRRSAQMRPDDMPMPDQGDTRPDRHPQDGDPRTHRL